MVEFAYFFSCNFDFSAFSAKKNVCQMGKSYRLILLHIVCMSANFIAGTVGRTSAKLVARKQFWLVWSIVKSFGWFGRLLTVWLVWSIVSSFGWFGRLLTVLIGLVDC